MAPEAEQQDTGHETWEMTETDTAFFALMDRYRELRRLLLIKRDEMNIAFQNRNILISTHICELETAEEGILSLYNEFTELYDSMKVIESQTDSYNG